MAYAFWMWSRMKVLGLLDNLRVCSKVKCPMKYKSRRNSSKISFANWASEFRLKSDIANFSPQYSSSKWSRHHWLCLVSLAKLHIPELESAAQAGSGRILCSGLGNVFLDRFKLLCTQMSCRCFVLPPWTTCVAAGASATPAHGLEGDASSTSFSLLACTRCFPDSSPELLQTFPHSGSDDPRVWECRTRKPGGLVQSNQP